MLGVLKLDFRFSPQTVVREVGMDSVGEEREDPVSLLRQFLAINTSHPRPDYQVLSNVHFDQEPEKFQESTRWLEHQAQRLGLGCQVQEAVQGKPTVLITR